MNFQNSLSSIGLLAAGLLLLSAGEALIPLHARGERGRRHLAPNIALTVITLITSLALNVPLLLGLAWLHANGWGLLNVLRPPAIIVLGVSVLALDLAWYATHVSLHKSSWMWRIHAVHHSDPAVDVTTTIRQHPAEGLIRYAYLAAFGAAFGVSPAGFALYRVWSALHGQLEHANLRLPKRLDNAIALLFASPNMHKVHHARDRRLTDRNFGNIFSVWDRLGGTFTPADQGQNVAYGLEGWNAEEQQSIVGLLRAPFTRRPSDGARASSSLQASGLGSTD